MKYANFHSLPLGDNYASIKSGHGLNENDYLVVRGKNYKITAINDDDCFYLEATRNVVRIDGSFHNNSNRQRFRFRCMPKLQGKIITFHRSNVATHHPVDISFKPNKGKNNHGNFEMCFHNIIFNNFWVYDP